MEYFFLIFCWKIQPVNIDLAAHIIACSNRIHWRISHVSENLDY